MMPMLPIGWPQRQAASVVRSYDYYVPAAEVEKIETARYAATRKAI